MLFMSKFFDNVVEFHFRLEKRKFLPNKENSNMGFLWKNHVRLSLSSNQSVKFHMEHTFFLISSSRPSLRQVATRRHYVCNKHPRSQPGETAKSNWITFICVYFTYKMIIKLLTKIDYQLCGSCLTGSRKLSSFDNRADLRVHSFNWKTIASRDIHRNRSQCGEGRQDIQFPAQ